MTRTGICRRMAVAMVCLGTALAAPGGAMALADPGGAMGPTRSVTGTWHLHTNDCFFGVCNYQLKLVQNRHRITSTPGSGIRGRIYFPKITINFIGVSSEDDWTCSGTVNSARTRISGTFTDGTGGSGTCVARKL